MKIAIDEVEGVLLQKKLDSSKIQEILKELQEIVNEIKNEPKGERVKWEHVIILDNKEGHLDGKEIVGWVVQQEEGEDLGTVLSRLEDAAANQNDQAKTKKTRITGISNLFEVLKSKFLKEKKLRIKTKELTRVVIVNKK